MLGNGHGSGSGKLLAGNLFRGRLRELVLTYWKRSDPGVIRTAIASQDIWSKQIYRSPSERIEWLPAQTS